MSSNKSFDNEKRCSFCGKKQSQVKTLIAGRDAYICNECLMLAHEMFNEAIFGDYEDSQYEESPFEGSTSIEDVEKPKAIKEMLDDYVIGQEEAHHSLRREGGQRTVQKAAVTGNLPEHITLVTGSLYRDEADGDGDMLEKIRKAAREKNEFGFCCSALLCGRSAAPRPVPQHRCRDDRNDRREQAHRDNSGRQTHG